MLDEFMADLEAIAESGASVVLKIDGGRKGDFPHLSYTVVVSGGKLTPDGFFRKDSADLRATIQEAIQYYNHSSR